MIEAYKYISGVMKTNRERPVRYFKTRITGYQVKLSAGSSEIKRAISFHSARLNCRSRALEP